MWVLDRLEDVRSDLSVFHRVDDMESMPARAFCTYAERLVHYDGALAGSLRVELAAYEQRAAAERAAGEAKAAQYRARLGIAS
jgi:hypothetical protein